MLHVESDQQNKQLRFLQYSTMAVSLCDKVGVIALASCGGEESGMAWWVTTANYDCTEPLAVIKQWLHATQMLELEARALLINTHSVNPPTHRLPVFSTSARRDVLLSAIGRLLPALDFGTVYLSCWRPVCLVTHNISSKAENSFILTILPRHCVITTSP